MSGQDEVFVRLDRITGLCQALARVSRTSARHKVLAEEMRAETAAYLALVDAQRGVDRKGDGRT